MIYRVTPTRYARASALLPEKYRGFLSPEAFDAAALAALGAACYADGRGAFLYVVEGDLRGLFALPEAPRGAGAALAAEATRHALAWSLDCFEGHLSRLYASLGWREVGRVAFDPARAPAQWRAENGAPDVVFMHHGAKE